MCADFAIHDKKDGDPHAHIMLTFRDVTPDGFRLKNTTWNENSVFLEWRKNWAEVNNRMFEHKGLEERIDHRSYKEQGIDREPMIHLGYEASALERKGIKTEKGNHNREVQRRNERRAALKEEGQLKTEKAEQDTEELRQNAKEIQLEKELQKIREIQKTAQHMEKPIEPHNEPPYVSTLEKQLKAEKAAQHIEKMREQQNTAEKIAERMKALKEKYIELETEKITLIAQHNKDKLELPPLEYRAELMDEHAENITALQCRLEQLQESRRNLRLLDLKKKKEADAQIAKATQNLEQAQSFFRNRFHIDPAQAPAELNRLQNEIRTKQDELATKQILVEAIRKKQATLELAYHTQKLLNETHPDREQITQLLEQTRHPPESIRDQQQIAQLLQQTHHPPQTIRDQQQITQRLEQTRHPPESIRDQQLRDRIEHQLNTINDTNFQKAIDNLPPYQARILTTLREQAKEQQRLIESEMKRNRTHDRSR